MKKTAHIVMRVAAVLTSGMVLATACDITDSVFATINAILNIINTWA